MVEISVTFPDGSVDKYPYGITAKEIAEKIGSRLAKDAIVAKVNDDFWDLNRPITKDVNLKILTFEDAEGKKVFWHSTNHILASAVKTLFPNAKLGIGPAIEEGFYYDFDVDRPFTPEDLNLIENEMKKIVEKKIPFERVEMTYKEAMAKNESLGEPYRVEYLKDIQESTIPFYKIGNFIDMCTGPHIDNTGRVRAFKLLKVSGAYWRGDSTKQQLQRIYGISFPTEEQLKKYLRLREEAEKRDHRKIVKDLDLVYFHEYAPGAPFFLYKGAIIYNVLIDFIREEYRKRGYQEVITPQLYNKRLWEISGHWEHYKENMFIVNIEGQEHSLKPMNCPSHCLIYNRDVRSYRDLPIRIADFCFIHRNEFSGTLTGLFRVRKFAQDDGHIFCRFDQIEEEVFGVLEFIKYVWNDVFGFKLEYYLSTRPEKAMGTKEMWDKAEKILANALTKAGISYRIKEGDGAFYGPKIDIDIEDALGRKWQCPTCQLDFNLPERFETDYIDEKGEKQRCVMIHRAVLGSLERFFGIMVEHYAGKFPLWLSPIQVRILSVSDKSNDFAVKIKKEFEAKGIRVDIDLRTESIPKKVREAQLEKIPVIITIGEKETSTNTLAIRTLDGKVRFGVSIDDFISKFNENVSLKKNIFEI